MWGLFTRALTLASSTVRVSVINTSANFMLTAVLGFIIFRESLPGEFQARACVVSDVFPLTFDRSVVAWSQLFGRGICYHWKTGRRERKW